MEVININQAVKEVGNWPTEHWLLDFFGTIAAECYGSDTSSYEKNKTRTLGCIKRGHTSVVEHVNLSITFTTDRATANALVRHRHCAFTQESTIYSQYKKLTVVNLPTEDHYNPDYKYTKLIASALKDASIAYDAASTSKRDYLPNCTACKLTMSTNLREWFYIINLRKDPADSPRMHELVFILDNIFTNKYPEIWKAFNSGVCTL
jgi:thymidylate synthase (FAD)